MTRTLAAVALTLAAASSAGGAEPPLVPSVAPSVAPSVTPPLQAAHQRPLTDVVFERTPERAERGRYLANHAIGCVLCHSVRDDSLPGSPPKPGREFAGAVVFDDAERYLAAPNLTPDPETGAGQWSDDQLARAIREGVGHDGRQLVGPMWWWAFRALSDEDLAAVVVYLRSLPPVKNAIAPPRISPERAPGLAMPADPLLEPVPARDLSEPFERGSYLVEIADCAGCHTAWTGDPNPGMFAGGNPIERRNSTAWSANITSDPSALGAWTPEIFRGRMRSGRGGALHPTMPWAAYRGMTDADLDAIFVALQRTNPVRHWVNNLEAPTRCAVCGQEHGMGATNVVTAIERAAVELGPLEAYVGDYRFRSFTIRISANGGALHASEGGPPVELVPVAGGRFAGRGLPTPLSFERDASGRIVALLTHELGATRWVRVTPQPPTD